jgi:hypothetical protein
MAIEEGTLALSLYRTSLLSEKVMRRWGINLMKGGSLIRNFEHIRNVHDALSRVNIGMGLTNVKYGMDTLIPGLEPIHAAFLIVYTNL